MIWSLISGLVHLLWEGTWSVMAPYLQAPSALHGWLAVWTTYGRADARYLHADPFVRSLELVTGTLVAALNLWAAWAFWRRRGERAGALALLVASVMEIYGDVMYFGSEWLNGWGDLDTHSFLHTWVMFVGLNVLWFVFPGWCVYKLLAPRVNRQPSPRPTATPAGLLPALD